MYNHNISSSFTNFNKSIKNKIDNFKSNYARAKEYQGYIDNLGPGDVRPVYHHCDRVRNEKALDNIKNFEHR